MTETREERRAAWGASADGRDGEKNVAALCCYRKTFRFATKRSEKARNDAFTSPPRGPGPTARAVGSRRFGPRPGAPHLGSARFGYRVRGRDVRVARCSMPAPARSATEVSPLAIVVALVAVNLAGKAGDALAALLVETRPLTLLALNANDAHMALTAGHTPFAPYVIVSLLRRLLEDPLYYHLGATRFASAVRVLDRTSPGILRKIEASKPWFERFSVLAVILEPGAVVCLLAGWSKMRAATFWSVNVFGTLARVLLVRRIGIRVSEWSAFAKASKFAQANRRVIAVTGFAIATAAAVSVLRGLKKAYAAENARSSRKHLRRRESFR